MRAFAGTRAQSGLQLSTGRQAAQVSRQGLAGLLPGSPSTCSLRHPLGRPPQLAMLGCLLLASALRCLGHEQNIHRGCGTPSQAAGCTLRRDQRLELVERGFGRSRSGWLADAIGSPRRMAVIGILGVAIGIELVADPGGAGLAVV
jgi:hypothetical protein